jgi:heme A synthase
MKEAEARYLILHPDFLSGHLTEALHLLRSAVLFAWRLCMARIWMPYRKS